MKPISLGGVLCCAIASHCVMADSERIPGGAFLPQMVSGSAVRTRYLRDIQLSAGSSRYGAWGAIDLCVFSHQGVYRVNVRDDQEDGVFHLTNGVYHVPCQVYFNDQPGLSGRHRLREGAVLSGLSSHASTPDCPSVNANLSVEIMPDVVLSSQAGRYSAHFLIEISPE